MAEDACACACACVHVCVRVRVRVRVRVGAAACLLSWPRAPAQPSGDEGDAVPESKRAADAFAEKLGRGVPLC
jgi:hypothetical protein